jgi:hypothetical protein
MKDERRKKKKVLIETGVVINCASAVLNAVPPAVLPFPPYLLQPAAASQ